MAVRHIDVVTVLLLDDQSKVTSSCFDPVELMTVPLARMSRVEFRTDPSGQALLIQQQ